ncbi:MAG: 3'-5' exonuclease [bacterium]
MLTPNRDEQTRAAAIQQAQDEILHKPVYLDTETTGLEKYDQIVEICVLDFNGSVLVDSLVKPTNKIPVGVTKLHGITDEMVKAAPTWPEIWPAVQAALTGRHVAIYSADYDMRVMKQSHRHHAMRWKLKGANFFCIMKLYAQFRGEWDNYHGSFRWHKLEEAGRQCKIELPNAHRAKADALLARAVLHYVAESK